MLASVILAVTAALLALRLLAELGLQALNRRELRRFASAPPPQLSDVMDEATYARSVQYSLARNSFGSVELVYGSVVLAVLLFGGLLPRWQAVVTGWLGTGVWAQAAWLFSTAVLASLPGLPLAWWARFRLEQRFGFNRSTLGLWVVDQLKGLLVSAALAVPLLALLLWLVGALGAWWWLAAFAVVLGFQLVMVVLYPRLILPLFSKLTPLPAGPLKERLMALAERTGYHAQAIQVIDGSRRSAHSNAYFTGFGRLKRIVLFDTLIEQLDEHQIEAVLAHEIGHYRRGHVLRRLALGALSLFVALWALAWVVGTPATTGAFGFAPGAAPALLLVSLCGGLVTFWFQPLLQGLSRRHEYEADRFAAEVLRDPGPLATALARLHETNLGNLTPHPVYSAVYLSHPTLHERRQALGWQAPARTPAPPAADAEPGGD